MEENTGKVFLHIGAVKTGTTYLQGVLESNRQSLADCGYALPGESWGDQVRAVQDVLGLTRRDPKIASRAMGGWASLTRAITSQHESNSIISMEWLSFASRRQAAFVIRSLKVSEVHVVLGIRDMTATLPGLWATNILTSGTASWPEFMSSVRKAAHRYRWPPRYSLDPSLRYFSRQQDMKHVLQVWGGLLPRGHLHVLTVPPSGTDPSVLWGRFCSSVGLNPGVASAIPEPANQSLGYASAELLRRVNLALGQTMQLDYNNTVKSPLASQILAQRSETEMRARLNLETRDFGLRWNHRTRLAVASSGAVLVGDINDLPVVSSDRLARRCDADQPEPCLEELLAAATHAVEGLDRVVKRRIRRLRKRGVDDWSPAFEVPVATPAAWREAVDPLQAAVTDIVTAARVAMELERRFRDSATS